MTQNMISIFTESHISLPSIPDLLLYVDLFADTYDNRFQLYNSDYSSLPKIGNTLLKSIDTYLSDESVWPDGEVEEIPYYDLVIFKCKLSSILELLEREQGNGSACDK